MFLKLARFELNYFRKQPSFYVTSIIFFLLTFFAMISDNVQIGGGFGNIHFNSPFSITQTILIMSVVGLFIVANFIGGTATRDTTYKMSGIIFSTSVTKTSYLWGRLSGSVTICLLIFLTVPLGILLGSFWPTVDAERLGPTQLSPYFWSYCIFAIPNFIFCSVLCYAFAFFSRSMMGMYLGVVGFFILYTITRKLMIDPSNLELAALLDPFGLSAFGEATRYWTPAEKNTQMISLSGNLLWNRIIWLSLSLLIILLIHNLMDIRKTPEQKTKKKKSHQVIKPSDQYITIKPSSGHKIDWLRFRARTSFEIQQIIRTKPFIILCLYTALNISSIFFNQGGTFGTPNWPLTRDMAEFIKNEFGLLIYIIIAYYSAESVWRERQQGMGDIIESTAISNWSIYFPKIIAMSLVIILLLFVGICFTVIYQASNGYSHFEWGVYAAILSSDYLIPILMTVILAFFIQVLSLNKYLGIAIFVVYFIIATTLFNLGMEHNMWHFAGTPSVIYSDMNGLGHFFESILWYLLFWGSFTIILAVLGFGLWRRGTEYNLSYRISQLKKQAGSKGMIIISLAACLFLLTGSYIFYNTRIINEFTSQEQQKDNKANYEKNYKQYADMLLPSITDVNINVNIFPQQRKIQAEGFYLIENRKNVPIEKALFSWSISNDLNYELEQAIETERNNDFNIHVAWIKFDPPLQAKEKRKLTFHIERKAKGFVDNNADNRVVENGTFIDSLELLPHFGYQSSYELTDKHERRKRDLPPPERLPKLEDSSQYRTNFISEETDFINFEATISTSEDQIAIAPGYLQKEWREKGRRYFHYKMDAPIFYYVAVLSGRYAVERDKHAGINIEIYYHPTHDMNIKRMIESVKASLDYFQQEFSPYQHRQVRIIEFPRYGNFAQSFSNTIPYSEEIGFIADLRDPEDVDYVYFVTAHEMAHQWWAHQVLPAAVQGSAVLSESLSEYSAYMVLEKNYGPAHLRKFLKWEMDKYLSSRGTELVEEMPLMRAENQSYIHYQKGGVILYALRDRLGEQVLNGALKKFLQDFQYAYDPYPTTLDLIKYIKADAQQQDYDFIDDLFSRITLFDLKMSSATASKLENDHYRLELTIITDKYYADGYGNEERAPLSEPLDIGIFSQDPDDPETEDHILYFKKHPIKSGENTFTIEVKHLPKYAGIDPYIKMIDRNSDDNLLEVDIQ